MGNVSTDFLTATPTFVTGMGSAVNLAGNFYGFNYSRSAQEADARALKADWKMVGQDISKTVSEAPQQTECPKK